MLKVVVFGSGAGMEIISDLIAREIPVEVIKVKDWKNAPYRGRPMWQVRDLTEQAIKKWIGRVSAIVLADTLAIHASEEYLKNKYPQQRIIGYGDKLDLFLRQVKKAMVLVEPEVRRMEKYQKIKAACQEVALVELDAKDWDEIECGNFKMNIDSFYDGVVVIYSTDMLSMERKLKNEVDWRADVADFKDTLLRDLCMALRLKGESYNREGGSIVK